MLVTEILNESTTEARIRLVRNMMRHCDDKKRVYEHVRSMTDAEVFLSLHAKHYNLNEAFPEKWKKLAAVAAVSMGIGAGIDKAVDYTAPDQEPKFFASPDTTFIDKRKEEIQQLTRHEDDEQISKLGGLEGQKLKDQFITYLTPIVRAENAKIKQERTELLQILKKKKKEQINAEDEAFIQMLLTKYKVKDGDVKELVQRVDTIPEEQAIGQAALESGWGTSILTKDGKNLFGMMTSNQTDFVKLRHGRFAKFNSFAPSVAAYMLNLNTNAAYERYRDTRHEMRLSGKVNVFTLITTLDKYAAPTKGFVGGGAYTQRLRHLILTNGLHKRTR